MTEKKQLSAFAVDHNSTFSFSCRSFSDHTGLVLSLEYFGPINPGRRSSYDSIHPIQRCYRRESPQVSG